MDNPFTYALSYFELREDPKFCLKVVSPKGKKSLMYQTADVNERFFMASRKNDLKEIDLYEIS